MYKILLLSPPVFDFYYTPARSEPLGLLYIKKGFNKAEGVCVDLYDARLSGKKKDMSAPEEFSYLQEFYQKDLSPFSLFSSYYRFGDSFNKIVTTINNKNYRMVAISSLFSGYHPDVEDLITRIKNETAALVTVGGWGTGHKTGEIFALSNADFFITGNGEHSLPLLVEALSGGKALDNLPGLFFRKPGKGNRYNKTGSELKKPPVCSGPIPEHIPISNSFPERENSYFFKGKKISKMVLSRGCPFKCDFCIIHQKEPFSIRSIDSIDRELAYLSSIGTEIVNFEDDNLFYQKNFSISLLNMLKKYQKSGMQFTAMNGITAKNIVHIVEDILEAGFIELNLSLVSADSTIQKKTNRPFGFNTIREVTQQVNGRIPVLVFLIAGLPGSDPTMLINDINSLAGLNLTIGISPLYIVPGARMFNNVPEPSNQRMMRSSALYHFAETFTRNNIASIWKYVRMINYLKAQDDLSSIHGNEYWSYFVKSIQRKQWYVKNRQNKWIDGFRFTCNFPDEVTICTYNGTPATLRLH